MNRSFMIVPKNSTPQQQNRPSYRIMDPKTKDMLSSADSVPGSSPIPTFFIDFAQRLRQLADEYTAQLSLWNNSKQTETESEILNALVQTPQLRPVTHSAQQQSLYGKKVPASQKWSNKSAIATTSADEERRSSSTSVRRPRILRVNHVASVGEISEEKKQANGKDQNQETNNIEQENVSRRKPRRGHQHPLSIRDRLRTSLAPEQLANAMNEHISVETLEQTVAEHLPESIVESGNYADYLRQYLDDFERELGEEMMGQQALPIDDDIENGEKATFADMKPAAENSIALQIDLDDENGNVTFPSTTSQFPEQLSGQQQQMQSPNLQACKSSATATSLQNSSGRKRRRRRSLSELGGEGEHQMEATPSKIEARWIAPADSHPLPIDFGCVEEERRLASSAPPLMSNDHNTLTSSNLKSSPMFFAQNTLATSAEQQADISSSVSKKPERWVIIDEDEDEELWRKASSSQSFTSTDKGGEAFGENDHWGWGAGGQPMEFGEPFDDIAELSSSPSAKQQTYPFDDFNLFHPQTYPSYITPQKQQNVTPSHHNSPLLNLLNSPSVRGNTSTLEVLDQGHVNLRTPNSTKKQQNSLQKLTFEKEQRTPEQQQRKQIGKTNLLAMTSPKLLSTRRVFLSTSAPPQRPRRIAPWKGTRKFDQQTAETVYSTPEKFGHSNEDSNSVEGEESTNNNRENMGDDQQFDRLDPNLMDQVINAIHSSDEPVD